MALRTQPGTYAFDNDDQDAANRHVVLAGILDEFTRSRLADLGDPTGWRCLELGAGGGSIARWLVEQVGSTGHVTATDVNTRHLPRDSGYQVLEHDLTTDPLPAGPWDLIHARLLLVHLPGQREILRQLVSALAPGGALVIEEWDSSLGSPLLVSPDPDDFALFEAYHRALREVLAAGGNDLAWPRQVHAAMVEQGLVDVDTVLHARAWQGGTAGARLHLVNVGQIYAELHAAGLTDAQLNRVRQVASDPRTVVRGLITTSTTGRRPWSGSSGRRLMGKQEAAARQRDRH